MEREILIVHIGFTWRKSCLCVSSFAFSSYFVFSFAFSSYFYLEEMHEVEI